MQNQPDLGREPIGRLLFKLALPTITAQLVNMLYNMVDRIYIGHIEGIGTAALTGVGVCMPLIMIISAFASLAAMGGAPLASIALGKGDKERAEGILGSCTALLLCISAVLTAVMALFHRPLLVAFGATEDVIGYACRYMSVYSLGTVFVQLSLGLNAYITAQGFSRVSMLTVLIGAVLNTILDPIFIFGFGMDVQGAALATIISQAVSAIFVLRFLTGRKTTLRLTLPRIRLNWKLLGPCVALGLSPFIMQSTESLIAVCFNTSLRTYGGTVAVSTMTLCTSIMQLAMLPLQGLSQGAQPIISYNFGAGNADRVRQGFRLLLICCLTFSVTLGVAVIAVPQVFLGIFTPDAALIEYAIPLVRTYMAGTVIFGIQIACQQTFVALGNAKCSLFLACLRKLILLIPLVYILPNFFGDKVFAVFLAEPVADIAAVTCTAILFFVVFHRTMRKLAEKAA
ncbi:MAG: MATE family efflux transporter [Clostridia bacterium]|nr:MATE family efflux transporter [Clostridia bacterium]